MLDSEEIITALQQNWTQIGRALGAHGQAFVDEYKLLNQAARAAETPTQQDQATADLIALLLRYPVVQQVLAQSDPATFSAPADPSPAPVGIAPLDPPPSSPTPLFTPAPVQTASPPTAAALLDAPMAAGTPAPPPVVPPDAPRPVAFEPAAHSAAAPQAPATDLPTPVTALPTSATFAPLHQQPDDALGGAAADGSGPFPRTVVEETSAMAQANTPATPLADSGGGKGTALKEWVAAILALTLVVGTVALIALAVYRGDGSEGTKNLLLLLTPLCGVVVGYYFGRIPSEAQAQAATARATQAVGEAARIKTTATDLIDEAADLGDKYAGGGGGPESATRSSDPAVVSVPPGLQRDLRELQKRARRLL